MLPTLPAPLSRTMDNQAGESLEQSADRMRLRAARGMCTNEGSLYICLADAHRVGGC